MKVTDKFVLFWGDYLGNWTKSQNLIHYWDKHWQGPKQPDPNNIFVEWEFPTSEHLFMYLKATHFKDWETAMKIVNAESPKMAKNLGRQVANFDEAEWEKVRMDAMFTAIYHRSVYDQPFKDRVLRAEWENLEFVEASPYDKIWGIGLKEDDLNANDKSKWPGMNLLGKCITELRRFFKFTDFVGTWQEHAFFEDMIWCPSQIEYYFTDPQTGKMFVVYCRWRWSDPWTVELLEVKDPATHEWDWSLYHEYLQLPKSYCDSEYREMEVAIVNELKKKFPHIQFPVNIVSKNHDDWDGPRII